jgi:hypothetical protein
VQLGRQSVVAEEVLDRIVAEHRAGSTYSAIARALSSDEVATSYGGRASYPSTVRNLVLANRSRSVCLRHRRGEHARKKVAKSLHLPFVLDP